MNMKVGIFAATSHDNTKKTKYLDALNTCINNTGIDKSFITNSNSYVECDLAVIFGFFGKRLGDVQRVRKNVYKAHPNKNFIFLDADLFRFLGSNGKLDKQNDDKNTFVRFTYGSIMFDKGTSFNKNCDSKRWDTISNIKKIQLKPYKDTGKHIIVCLNGNPETGYSWSAGDTNPYKWGSGIIRDIRKYTNKDIILRFHPNSKDDVQEKIPLHMFKEKRIFFSGGINMKDSRIIKHTSLADDCQDAFAAVCYNTSASVTPMIEGVPVFTDQPSCPVYSIANHSVKNIKNPLKPDRLQWVHDASYSLYNYEEVLDGTMWNHFRSNLDDKGFAK